MFFNIKYEYNITLKNINLNYQCAYGHLTNLIFKSPRVVRVLLISHSLKYDIFPENITCGN